MHLNNQPMEEDYYYLNETNQRKELLLLDKKKKDLCFGDIILNKFSIYYHSSESFDF